MQIYINPLKEQRPLRKKLLNFFGICNIIITFATEILIKRRKMRETTLLTTVTCLTTTTLRG